MEVVENVALISINATILVQLISFLIFMVLFNRIMIKPLRKIMAERTAYIVRAQEKIKGINDAYEAVSRQIVEQEAEARRSAFEIRKEIEASGKLSVGELMAETKQEIRHIRLAAQKDTNLKITRAREQVASEADVLADQMIATLLDRSRSLS